MIEIYASIDFREFVILMPALVLVELLAHHSVHPIIDRYLPHTFTRYLLIYFTWQAFVDFSVQILLHFIELFHIVTSGVFILHFLSSTFTVACSH